MARNNFSLDNLLYFCINLYIQVSRFFTAVYFTMVFLMTRTREISKNRFLVPYIFNNKIHFLLISPVRGFNPISVVVDEKGNDITELFHRINGADRNGILATPKEIFHTNEIIIQYIDGRVYSLAGNRFLTEVKTLRNEAEQFLITPEDDNHEASSSKVLKQD